MKLLFKHRFYAWRGESLLFLLWFFHSVAKPHWLRQRYRGLLIHLIKKTELFDRTYYLDSNPDVVHSNISPLRHYAAYGDAEQRWPMPLFDPAYYRARVTGKTKDVNALLHYYHVGRYRLAAPSSWFDLHYYLSNNKDIARSGQEPLRHYVLWGGSEGRSPNAQFDAAYYLRTNPDVRAARLNPLLHYLQWGRFDQRPTRELFAQLAQAVSKIPEQVAHWPGQAMPKVGFPPQVDLIIPVYKDAELTRRCLFSVLSAHNETACEIIVIDDASPETAIRDFLDELASRGAITLRRHARNLGFVASVNAGMAEHPDRDLVLLNADTEVYHNWLDRLRAAAHAEPDIATVTPLSNNATICSYPRFLHDTPYPLETDYAALDAMAARVNAKTYVETPTGVGFCLYIRRAALHQLGLFDLKAFGRGYGEENDFCQRALAAGWRHLIAADTFVRHIGAASFRGEKGQRIALAMRHLAKRYPSYQQQVDAFIRQDPLAPARQRLDWERLRALACQDNILIVYHNRGGGAERHVQEDTEHMQAKGQGVFYLRPDRARATHVRLAHPQCRQLLNLPTHALGDTPALAAVLRPLSITRIHSHGLIDFTAEAPVHLLALARALDCPLDVDIHDYKVICPRVNLANRQGRYCGEPSAAADCNRCLASEGNDFGVTDIRVWRAQHAEVMQAAERIWVPDPDVAERLQSYYPDLDYRILPHEQLEVAPVPARRVQPVKDQPLRILVIGALSKLKGYEVLLACARDARQRRLPLAFHLLGYSIKDAPLIQAGVQISGRYLDVEADARLQALDPHLVWLPSTWPETYSYTLSLALRGGYPVVAFDLGAIARRLRALDHPAALWPLALADRPRQINERFMRLRQQGFDATAPQPPSNSDSDHQD